MKEDSFPERLVEAARLTEPMLREYSQSLADRHDASLEGLKRLLTNIHDIEPEFAQVVEDNFWDLV